MVQHVRRKIVNCQQATNSGVQWRSQRGGSEMGEISSLSDLGAHFQSKLSSAATFHCEHSMEEDRLQAPKGQCQVCKANLKPRGPIPVLRVSIQGLRGPFENKVGENI